ncbi:cation-transporting P-type ATPase [Bradyrhizobium sp. th.b2]|uniref:cation-transporting P-type ATPase n=1 Tax=Bradyrhizobium sp. th-b2 TaxID=172088 RepID=UPI001FD9F949|nr:cation-transporting P-type ATPase [Bradyrhizobium sp. th.b2]
MPLKPSTYGPAVEAFWREPTSSLLRTLDAPRRGLRQQEAERRLAQIGPNLAEPSQTRSMLQKVVHRLINPLIAILIVAAAVSGFSGDLGSFAIIVLVGPVADAGYCAGTSRGSRCRCLATIGCDPG